MKKQIKAFFDIYIMLLNQHNISVNHCIIQTNNTNFVKQMFSQPNIVLRFPQEYENMVYSNNNHRGSPIKALHRLYDIDAVTADYLTLFGEEKPNQTSQPHQRESRKLNIGEKIKNKLQSTNNKSSRVLSNPKFNISQFNCDNSSSEESKLYENSYQIHKQQKQHQRTGQISEFQTVNQKQFSDIKSSIRNQNQLMKLYRQTSEESCHQQSPYNNISAKTYQSSPDVNSEMSHNSQSTPINNLNNMSGIDTPLSQPHQLHLYKHLIGEVSSFKYLNNNDAQLIKLNKIEFGPPSVQIKDVLMVSSRSIDAQHREKIQNVQSVCISCDYEQDHLTGYQYAMKQLKKLSQNVYQLEIASKNLIDLKTNQNSGIFPSYIGKIQSKNKLNQSFLQFFQENLKDILYEPERQQIFCEEENINEQSAQFCSQKYSQTKNKNQMICQTPKDFKSGQKQNVDSSLKCKKNLIISQKQKKNVVNKNLQAMYQNIQQQNRPPRNQNAISKSLNQKIKQSNKFERILQQDRCVLSQQNQEIKD